MRILLFFMLLVGISTLSFKTFSQPQPSSPQRVYWVQVGAWRAEVNAQTVKKRIEELGYTNCTVIREDEYHKVRVGSFPTVEEARKVSADLMERLFFPGKTNFWILAKTVSAVPESAAAVTVTPSIFGILANSFVNQVDAFNEKASLEAKGYYPVSVVFEEPLYHVFIGRYKSETEGEPVLAALKKEGYINAFIKKISEPTPTGTIVSAPEEEKERAKEIAAIEDRATEFFRRRQYDQAILEFEKLLQMTADNAKAIKLLQEAHLRLSEEQRKLLEEEKRKRAEEESKRRIIDNLHSEAMVYWEKGNLYAAIDKWGEILKIDPGNSRATLYIALARDRLKEAPPQVTKELDAKAEKAKRLEKIYEEASKVYRTGIEQKDVNLIREAITQWERIIAEEPVGPIYSRAQEAITNARIQIDEIKKVKQTAQRKLFMLIGGIIIGVLVVGLIVTKGVSFLVSLLKAREKIAKPRRLKKRALTEEELFKQQIEEQKRKEAEEREAQFQMYYTRGCEALEREDWEEAIRCFLQARALNPDNPDAKGKLELARTALQEQEKRLLEEKKKVAAVQKPAPTETVEEKVIVSEPVAPEVEEKEKILFSQDFDNEPTGAFPQGWIGEFPYASLIIDDTVSVNKPGKSIKFEKREPAGATHFRVRFPNITQKASIEFDLKCDSKNKYFLGIYLEDNEDFRKAIHTVVQADETSSEAFLRLQGESIPYKLGTWQHIKFVIDLKNYLVDGFVDGKQVCKQARIPGTPETINTLSIRDNPATTAILYLDNIVVKSLP